MKKLLYILPLLLALLAGCKKETITLLTQQVESNTRYGLYDVFFADDSIGYACGGDRWTMGQVIYTRNGGLTWSQPDSIYPECAYACQFFSANEGFVAGNVSNYAYTTDSGKTFTRSQTNFQAILAMRFIDKQHGIKAGGEGYTTGYIGYTADGGNSWSQQDYATAINAVCYADSNTALAVGFGVIYRSVDKGATFAPLDVRGDNFLSCSFPTATTGYVIGYEGLIYKTTDGGNSFSKIRKGNAPFAHREYFRRIAFWDENTGYIIGDGGIMYRTTNGGDSWAKVESFTSSNLRSIHLFSATAGIVVGDNGSIYLFRQ